MSLMVIFPDLLKPQELEVLRKLKISCAGHVMRKNAGETLSANAVMRKNMESRQLIFRRCSGSGKT